jgi:hypothetical protein
VKGDGGKVIEATDENNGADNEKSLHICDSRELPGRLRIGRASALSV